MRDGMNAGRWMSARQMRTNVRLDQIAERGPLETRDHVD